MCVNDKNASVNKEGSIFLDESKYFNKKQNGSWIRYRLERNFGIFDPEQYYGRKNIEDRGGMMQRLMGA